MTTQPDATPIKKLPPEVEALSLTIQNEFTTLNKKQNWIIGRELSQGIDKLGNTSEIKGLFLREASKAYQMDCENLDLCMRFYELYPDYRDVQATLSMEHYNVLVTVPKGWERNVYEKKAQQQKLSPEQLKTLIKNDIEIRRKSSEQNFSKLPVQRIEPYIYRITKLDNEIAVDMGFFLSKIITPGKMPEGDFVKIIQKDSYGENLVISEVDNVATPHYLYKAHVKKVLDGDVLELHFEAGLGLFITREVRLRGVYSQPLLEEHKQSAKQYIEACLGDCKFVAVRTYWQESFECFLADIFYDKNATDLAELSRTGTFLNQELIDKGFSLPY